MELFKANFVVHTKKTNLSCTVLCVNHAWALLHTKLYGSLVFIKMHSTYNLTLSFTILFETQSLNVAVNSQNIEQCADNGEAAGILN